MYTNFTATSRIDTDTGVIRLPVGKQSPESKATTAKIVLHSGFSRRIVSVSAERLQSWPELPAPRDFTDSNGINHTVEHWAPAMQGTTISADGRKTLHQMEYELVYSLSRPPAAGEALPAYQLPYVTRLPDASRRFPAEFFVDPKIVLD
jgi:hypothetical protein